MKRISDRNKPIQRADAGISIWQQKNTYHSNDMVYDAQYQHFARRTQSSPDEINETVPPSTSAKWTLMGTIPAWQLGVLYPLDFIVEDAGILYKCVVAHTSVDYPSISPNWIQLTSQASSSAQTVITYTTSRNSVSADLGSWIRYDSSSNITYYIDQEQVPGWPLMSEITIEQVGTGKITVGMAGGTHGAIVVDQNRAPRTRGAGSVIKIRKVVDSTGWSNDRFIVFGELDSNLPNVPELNSDTGVLTVDLSASDYFQIYITENITSIVFTNLPGSLKPSTKMFEIFQDPFTPYTVAWPASFKWEGAAPVVSNTANAVDILAITSFDNGTTWHGTLSKGRV